METQREIDGIKVPSISLYKNPKTKNLRDGRNQSSLHSFGSDLNLANLEHAWNQCSTHPLSSKNCQATIMTKGKSDSTASQLRTDIRWCRSYHLEIAVKRKVIGTSRRQTTLPAPCQESRKREPDSGRLTAEGHLPP